jgi:hypothetical protein
LRQTVQDFEVLIVGDGISEEGRSCAAEFANLDRRIRLHELPKGPRHGECWRHEVLLNHAAGHLITYLSDDDIFLSNHLEKMASLLSDHNFAHPLPGFINTRGDSSIAAGDLAVDVIRHRLLSGIDFNFIGLSGTSHTLDLYKRLPHGWRTTPAGTPTDLYMWQQFLSHSDCNPVTGEHLTTLHFPSSGRNKWPLEERLAELMKWEDLLLASNGEAQFHTWTVTCLSKVLTCNYEAFEVMRLEMDALAAREVQLLAEKASSEAESVRYLELLRKVEEGRWFRLKRFLGRLPIFGRVVQS